MTVFRALILIVVGALLYYLLFRMIRKGVRETGVGALWVAAPITVLFRDKSGTPFRANPKTRPFVEALSEASFAKASVYLASVAPGDAVEMEFREALNPAGGPAIPLADGWIGDYSGRHLRQATGIGQPIALEGDTLYGIHLFGSLHGNHNLVPVSRLITRARFTLEASPAPAQGRGQVPTIWVDGHERALAIGDVTVQEVVPVEGSWVDADLEQIELKDNQATLETLFKEPLTPECFQNAERKLGQLVEGCSRWEMIQHMGGRLITLLGCDAIMRMEGYLNFVGAHRWSKTTPEGIFLAQPFGYMEGTEEVPKQVAVFLNDRFHRLLPFSPKEEMERELGI